MNDLIVFNAQYLYLIELVVAAIYFLLQPKGRKRSMIVLSIVFLPSAYVLDKIATLLYFNPRPFVVGHFTPIVPHIADNGFPSDHMLLGSVVATMLCMYNKKIGVAAWAVAFAVGASRVAAGVHHWVDILGSVVIAVVAMWIADTYMMPRLIERPLFNRLIEKENNK
jgi:undecaprenyl-diphosphatase